MATHSSVLAWRIPGTGEPGGLPSMGSHRVGHDWSDLAAAAAAGWSQGVVSVELPMQQDEKRRNRSPVQSIFSLGTPSGNLSSFLVRHSAQGSSEGANRACCVLETFVFMLPDKKLNPVKWQRTTYCYLHLSSNFQPTIALKSNRSFQLQRDWASNQHFQWSFKISFHPSSQKQNFFIGIGMQAALLLMHTHPPHFKQQNTINFQCYDSLNILLISINKYVAQKLDVHFLIASLWSRTLVSKKLQGLKGLWWEEVSVNWFLGARMMKRWRLQRLCTLNRYELYDMWIRSHKTAVGKKKKKLWSQIHLDSPSLLVHILNSKLIF